MLLNQLNKTDLNIFFLKAGSGKICDTFYTSNSFKHETYRKYIGFLHGFSGCDTTSGFAGKGKIKTLKLLLNNPELSSLADSYYEKECSKKTIAENGKN